MISVIRPMLRLQLSWVDSREGVRFDNVSSAAANEGLLPYTPHTTGPAGLFAQERFRQFRAGELTTPSGNPGN